MTAQRSWRALTYFLRSSIPKGPRNAWHCLAKVGQQWHSPAAEVTPQCCSLVAVTRFPCHRASSPTPSQHRGLLYGDAQRAEQSLGTPSSLLSWTLHAQHPSSPRNLSLQQPSLCSSPQTHYGVDWSVTHPLASRWKGLPGSTALGQKSLKAALDLKQIASPAPKELARGHLYRHSLGGNLLM